MKTGLESFDYYTVTFLVVSIMNYSIFYVVQTTVTDSNLFDHLINIWEFSPGSVPGTCNLYFLVDFKFQSPLYRQVSFLWFILEYCIFRTLSTFYFFNW